MQTKERYIFSIVFAVYLSIRISGKRCIDALESGFSFQCKRFDTILSAFLLKRKHLDHEKLQQSRHSDAWLVGAFLQPWVAHKG